MTLTEPGFLRPHQSATLSAVEEADIAAVCPGLGQRVQAKGQPNPVLWGPHRDVVTGWSTDPDLRFSGASGGALSALLVHLLDSDTVDAIVQTTAAADLPIGNTIVISTNREDILKAAGSRYAPSAPLADLIELIAEHKASGRRFAVVGKPCDAAALRAMCSRDPVAAAAFPVIVSFFCAGVPSHKGGEQILTALGTDLTATAQFRFRGNGWPGHATATDHEGTKRTISYHESWGKILSKHVQHRCKLCADGTGVAADIVCADAWESDAAGYPIFDEAPGVSLIVARTDLGTKIVAAARAAGRIETTSFDISDLTAIQPGQRERRRALLARLLGQRLAGRPIPRYEGLQIAAAARQNPLHRNLRNFLGSLRRALRLTQH
ncbi:Coenzyme F420 hydrogenase/dehydrogenase, beta subunit C-terminal domain [Roseobacter sp. N2S]|uniref:Coenzyme F420 hydrogenase/dehydrogenase, beta subunit C-terminal domain n=1 Tax=Roseobacter sp. N2S TaxID=2663844 RepID=UPI00285B16A0|nr:Coenzyme F420 hydrogenase/dehydrogenase, beta subunit C-terminal domain [Roseobacter sp. N2S]MDR6267654.1 coenzyme F420 hydrogenase subunit beta [Roseobacter sp. N2S]